MSEAETLTEAAFDAMVGDLLNAQDDASRRDGDGPLRYSKRDAAWQALWTEYARVSASLSAERERADAATAILREMLELRDKRISLATLMTTAREAKSEAERQDALNQFVMADNDCGCRIDAAWSRARQLLAKGTS